MDVLDRGRQPDGVAGLYGDFARSPHCDLADAIDMDVEEGIAADMLGDADGAVPGALVAGDGDVLGAHAYRYSTFGGGRGTVDQVHLGRADESGNEKIDRPVVE